MTREEFLAEAWPVLAGLKGRRARVRLSENIDLAEDDARKLIGESARFADKISVVESTAPAHRLSGSRPDRRLKVLACAVQLAYSRDALAENCAAN